MGLFSTKPLEQILKDAVGPSSLKRSLGPVALVALGIGCVVGAGIFTLTGVVAATLAGPAVVISFVLAAVVCIFAALAYSEFAAMIPVAGSAYTFTYATMGEMLAWIIGWDLILEYGLGAAAVAIGWSRTFIAVLSSFGLSFSPSVSSSPFDYVRPPGPDAIHSYVNLPAVLIVVFLSLILIYGIEESARVNALIVALKLVIILSFIILGWSHMVPSNHSPFIPQNVAGIFGRFGWSGVVRGAGVLFFAYLGFDAVSTAAQEARTPQRDMPIGILGTLLICTVLFCAYAYVLTGIVSYQELNVAAPLTVAVGKLDRPFVAAMMNCAVLCGLTSVLLVILLGQARIFYSMAQDGLIPPLMGRVHSRFHTPWLATLALMVFVSLLAAFAPIALVGSMTSIGTLFAFILVSVSVLILRRTRPDIPRPFRVPGASFILPLGIACNLGLMLSLGGNNWIRLVGWLAGGLVIYFCYGRRHSRLKEDGPKLLPSVGLGIKQ